jgi:hypothetical protein
VLISLATYVPYAFRLTKPYRSVGSARLTETAPVRTSPHHFDSDPVMDDLNQRNYLLYRIIGRIKIADTGLLYYRRNAFLQWYKPRELPAIIFGFSFL